MRGISTNINYKGGLFLIPVHITINLIKILKKTVNSNHDILYFIALEKLFKNAFTTVERICERLCDNQV